MWNWLVSVLASKASIVLFDGSPMYKKDDLLLKIAEKEKITLFGISAKYVDALRKSKPTLKYKYKLLFGKNTPIHKKTLIQVMNRDLKYTCEVCNLPYNIKSHSFRVNIISNLLKITTVQNTADIIGHQDIRSTMAYRRYALSKEEINDLLERITDGET